MKNNKLNSIGTAMDKLEVLSNESSKKIAGGFKIKEIRIIIIVSK